MSLNTKLFFKINGLVGRSRTLDFFGTVGAEYAVIMIYFFLAAEIFVMNWPDFLPSFGLVVFLFVAWLIAWLINLVVGKIVREPRPHMTHPESKLLFTPLMSWKSFPSDHGMSAWLAVFFALLIGLPLVFPLVILALWVSWGRVYAGVHYPIDIFGGAAVAGFVIACFYFLI